MSGTQRPSLARWAALVLVALVAFVAGYLLRDAGSRAPTVAPPRAVAEGEAAVWSCSMHPQIRLPEPGQCPICFMDLVPAGPDAGARAFVLSATERALARIRTVPVARRAAVVEVRMVGKIDYDESRIRDITSYISGRLERMYVDYTGVAVNRGDHMVDIYSPELIAAQEELVQAIEAEKALERSELEIMRRTAAQTVTAAREKLRLWGLLPEQIAEIERRGTPTERVTLYSPMTGVVIQKHATQGVYVETGSPIYTVADLKSLWVRLEAYESDLEWLHVGQQVEFTTEAFSGEVFRGRVSFIDPVIGQRTRTVKLRVNVANERLRLKPEMLVRAVVHARAAGAGRVFDPYLAGKWIGPMHPEIVKDGPGACDICGMPLVSAASLGYVADAEIEQEPLMIPATAPLITGKRAVVYLERMVDGQATYEGREVVLGPRAGEWYIVRSGLREGERVVVEGGFKIDSALQIRAEPSMMSPAEDGPPAGHDHGPAERRPGAAPGQAEWLTPLYEGYLELQRALVDDDAAAARSGFDALESAVNLHPPSDAEAKVLEAWRGFRPKLQAALIAGRNSLEPEGQRAAFHELSRQVIKLARTVGHALAGDLLVAFCPMAFAEGAEWLQVAGPLQNPYMGQAMPRCGSPVETLSGAGSAPGDRGAQRGDS